MRRLLGRRQGMGRGTSVSLQRMATQRPLLALSGLGAGYYETALTGGESGVATGFGFVVLCRLWQNVASATRAVIDNFYTSPIEGFTLNTMGSNTSVLAAFVSGAAASTSTPTITLSPSDNGRILALVGQHTGTGVRLSVYRGSFSTSTAITGYAPCTRKLSVGRRANVGNLPADGVDLISWGTFRGVPSDAQIAAWLDAARTFGDLPKTLPASWAPVYAVRGFTVSNYLETGLNFTTGAALDVTFDATVYSLSGTKFLVNHAALSAGFAVFTNGVAMAVHTYVTGNTVVTAPLSAADMGEQIRWRVTFAGGTWSIYREGVLQQAAAGSYTPIAAGNVPLRIGISHALGNPGDNAAISRVTFAGLHDYNLHADIVANGGTVPASMPDRIGTDHLTRTGAPTAVALGGTLTHRWSAREAIGTTYNPVGRRTYGVTGFSAANYLQTAGGVGGVDATPFHTELFFRVDSQSTDDYDFLLSKTDGTTAYGWQFYSLTGNGTLVFQAASAGGAMIAAQWTIPASRVGSFVHAVGQFTGTHVELWVDGVMIQQTAITGYRASPVVMRLGIRAVSTTGPVTHNSVFLLGGGAQALTAGEISTKSAEAHTKRTVSVIPKDEHVYLLTQDIAANGNTVPAQVLDRVGTDHLTAVDGLRVTAGNALSGFTVTNHLLSPVGAVAGATLDLTIDMRLDTVPVAANKHILNCVYGSTGFFFTHETSGNVVLFSGSSSSTVATSAITGADQGVTHAWRIVHTGGVWRLFKNGVQQGSDTTATYVAPTGGLRVGVSHVPSLPADTVSVFRVRVDGHDWNIALDVAANAGSAPALITDRVGVMPLRRMGTGLQPALHIATGPAAPASLPDTATGASVDAMNEVGAATVASIDTTSDGRKTFGALGFSATNALTGAVNAGLKGDASGFWGAVLWRCDRISTAPQSIVEHASTGGAFNWAVESVSPGALRLGIRSTTFITSPTVSLVAGDVGVVEPLVWNLEGTNFRLYRRNALIATVAGVTYTYNAAGQMSIGRFAGGSQPLESSVFQLLGGDLVGGLSPAQIAEVFDSFQRTGKLVAPTGAPAQHSYDLTADINENGGPANGVPLQVRDRIGADHLTRVGGLVVSGGGLTSFGASGYPQSVSAASGLPGLATGLWVETLIVAPPTAVIQNIFSNTGTGANGLHIRLANNNVVTAIFGNGTVTFTSFGATTLTPGQTYHLATVYDGSVATTYINGSSAGGIVTAAFTLVPGTQPTKLGTLYAGTSDPATTLIIRGVAGGHVAPTAGEIAAASAYALANGRVGGIAGKTLRIYDIAQDVVEAGGRVPGLIKDRVSGVDHLAVIGAPLQVAQRTERLWGWEAA